MLSHGVTGISSVQSLSCVWLCHPKVCSMPGLPVHHQLLEFTQTHVCWVSDAPNHLIVCHPLLLPPSIFPSMRVFSNVSILCIKWPQYWTFSFNISPSNEYSGLISFRMNWLDLLAFQRTLKSLLQHHSSKASILWHSAFFIVQLSHPHLTFTGIKQSKWLGKVGFISAEGCATDKDLGARFLSLRSRFPALAPHRLRSNNISWMLPQSLLDDW